MKEFIEKNQNLVIIIGVLLAALIIAFVLVFIFVLRPLKFRKLVRELDNRVDYTHSLLIGQGAQYVKRLDIISATNLLFADTHARFAKDYKELCARDDIDTRNAIFNLKDLLNGKKYSEFKKAYKSTLTLVNRFEIVVGNFTKELFKVIKPEEDCRTSSLEYKEQLRHIKSEYYAKENELALVADSFNEVFESLDELFGEFDNLVDSAHYDDANDIISKISAIIHELSGDLQELPSICAYITKIVPDKISDVNSAHKILIEEHYPLHNLFVNQTIETMKRNLDIFTNRIRNFDLEGVRDNLENMVQQLEDLENKFSKEKVARAEFEEKSEPIYNQVNTIERRFITLNNIIPEVSKVFVINQEHKDKIASLEGEVNRIGIVKRQLDTFVHAATKQPYTTLVKKMNEMNESLDGVFQSLDEFDAYIDSLKVDADAAYTLVYDMFDEVKKAEQIVRQMNLPATTEKYKNRLEEIYNLIDQINTCLVNQPIDVDKVNENVRLVKEHADTLLFEGEIAQDHQLMVAAEIAIMRGNKHRNHDDEIDEILTKAETLFDEGKFVEANELAKTALAKIKQNHGRR